MKQDGALVKVLPVKTLKVNNLLKKTRIRVIPGLHLPGRVQASREVPIWNKRNKEDDKPQND